MAIQTQFPRLLGVQMKESARGCNIAADLKGFYADEVTVSATNETLVVEMTSNINAGQSYYLGELEPERHVRTIPLGFAADTKSVMTHYNNGKLEILVHKAGHVHAELTASAA